ncbi:hypothetical protein [Kitasatospora sp. NPDC094016]|uniref:hypothetical protein n=1 Tax=Kitasatospora sp. NPDC094016 TaxID=3154986 RepID=UPI003333DC6F
MFTAQAAVGGVELTMPDALCAAAAHRLGVPLLATDLLPTEEDRAVAPQEQDGQELEPAVEHDIDGDDQDVAPGPAALR